MATDTALACVLDAVQKHHAAKAKGASDESVAKEDAVKTAAPWNRRTIIGPCRNNDYRT